MTAKKLTFLTFAIILISILSITIIEQYRDAMHNIKRPELSHKYSYLDNPNYKIRNELFSTDTAEKKIVMLGNSLTSMANWGEILNRTDVANRGIGSDITEGYLNRINTVLSLNPKICFIEGGVNDISKRIPASETLINLGKIVDTLNYHGVKPVLTTVTLVSKGYSKSRSLNLKIKKLNPGIISLAQDRNITLIDLNLILSDGNYLGKDFAEKDGIHLTSEAYSLWAEEVVKVLNREKL